MKTGLSVQTGNKGDVDEIINIIYYALRLFEKEEMYMDKVEEKFRDPKSLYDVKSFYDKGAVLKASYQGMRYQVERVTNEEEKYLRGTVWPEPFCFEKTAEEKKESKEFEYTEEGLAVLHQWLLDKYELDKDKWEHARDFPLDGVL